MGKNQLRTCAKMFEKKNMKKKKKRAEQSEKKTKLL